MKAILVINMPIRCAECPLHYRKRREIYRCELTHQDIPINNKPTWCPLKPLPEMNTWDVTENGHVTEFAEGWNACLEEITGETE